MQKRFSILLSLLKHAGILLLFYTFSRLLFYGFNYSYFKDIGIGQLFYILICGVRFDLSVIILSNALFFILYLLPFQFTESNLYRKMLKGLFIVVNSIAMLANCVDFVYFQFTLKRTTADIFNYFGGGIGNDLGRLLPLFLKDYWYIFIIWIVFSYFISYFYKKIEKKSFFEWNRKGYLDRTIVFILSAGLMLVGYRGGFPLKPISIITAGEYVSVKYVPLVISTPFSILKTIDVEGIEPVIYFNDEKRLASLYNPKKKPNGKEFKKLNVFVIALESFSKEYVGALNGRATGYTPFLDSLISKSFTCTNAFSNGKRSIEGIPAIVSGLPTWMNEPYLTSRYGSNQINSLANMLKQEGYYAAFFHGGENGTMGFDAFTKLAGYDNYYGRKEYNNEKDYDGNWGIWDEEFLQYTANTLNEKKQPFLATLFTLTSHHPYPIPDRYKGKFKKGILEIEQSIGYTDYSLRKFFETAKKMPWFNNTLFVLSADHTGVSLDPYYTNRVGNNAIPIIYYLPNSNLIGFDSTITQQIDILPSVLDYLNYPSPYFAFGNSVFDTTANHYAMSFNNETYQLIQNNYSLQFDGEKALDLYNLKTDSLLGKDLLKKEPATAKQMENKAKAIIQSYKQSLINNTMH